METMPDASTHLYYGKIFSLIKKIKIENIYNYFPKSSSARTNKMAMLFHLWKDLEEWSTLKKKGQFTYYRGDYQVHASKARINAILSYKERSKVYKKLVAHYDKNVLPNKIDIIPVVQSISTKYGGIFTRKAIIEDHHKDTKSNNKFIRDAIYNIIISDIKNEFIQVTKKTNFVKVENLIGVLKVNDFPTPSIISHVYINPKNQNHKFLNNKENKDVANNWLNGGSIKMNGENYNILGGPIKLFSKNQKSMHLAGASAYTQVNRIIDNGGTYVIGAYKKHQDFHLFESWVEKHKHTDLNQSLVDIKDITSWEFYRIKNPCHNLPEYRILIQKNNQKEFHSESPKIILKEGLKIGTRKYLREFEPKIIFENFNYYKYNEQYDIAVTLVNLERDEKETTLSDYALSSFEDFIQLKINYNSFDHNFRIRIELNIIDEENDIDTLKKEFDIISAEINKETWNKSFNNYAFIYPEVESGESINTELINTSNIFDSFSLDIHQNNFNNIQTLLVEEKYLSSDRSIISQDQLALILERIFTLKDEYENEEEVSVLITLIHFVQLFDFIFRKSYKSLNDISEFEFLERILEKINKSWLDGIDDNFESLESFINGLNIPYNAPFLIWSILKTIVIDEDNRIKIEELLKEFLIVSFDDYNQGTLSSKKELWRYNELILFIYMIHRKKTGDSVSMIINDLKKAWVIEGNKH